MSSVNEYPKPEWSMPRLRRRVCGACEQTLDQCKRGQCGAIYSDTRDHCYWVPYLTKKPTPAASSDKQ